MLPVTLVLGGTEVTWKPVQEGAAANPERSRSPRDDGVN